MANYPSKLDYIHIDDHQHNSATAGFLRDWLSHCTPKPYEPKVWFSQLNIIPLRHYIQDDDTMPNGRKPKPQTANTDSDWRGFVNVELSDDEWAIIDKEMKEKGVEARVPAHLDYLLELGKVTFNYTNNSLVCSLTILDGINKGFTVSSFSDSLIEALLTTRLKVQNHQADFETIFAGGGVKRRRG